MNSTDDLFGKTTFLAWLPGETLFSLVSRHHCFWGHTLAARTCEQFFGHSRAGSQHDLPSRLSHFVVRTDGCFGDVETIAKNYTLLAYYAAFVSANELKNAIACMAGDSVAHLKLRLGILTSRFRAIQSNDWIPVSGWRANNCIAYDFDLPDVHAWHHYGNDGLNCG